EWQDRRARRRRHRPQVSELRAPRRAGRLPAGRERAAPLRVERGPLAPPPVVDTKPRPRTPTLVKVIEGEEVMAKTGYAAPHTVHCGPDGIYLNALGGPDGDGPGGIFMLDHDSFE